MEHCSSILLSFPKSGQPDKDNEAFSAAIRTHIRLVETLVKEHSAAIHKYAIQLLKLLNPSTFSASFLIVLDIALRPPEKGPKISLNDLQKPLTSFLLAFDPRQIRYFGGVFVGVIDAVLDRNIFPPSIAVELVTSALLRLDPSASLLTSSHCRLVEFAYHSDTQHLVLPLIDKPILYFFGQTSAAKYLCDLSLPPTAFITPQSELSSKLTIQSVLEYELVCGLIYCSRRDWQKAWDAFARCISHPFKDGMTSKVVVSAYKKWLLVSLILFGMPQSQPALMSRPFEGPFNTLVQVYQEAANIYPTTNAASLKTYIEKYEANWANDQNSGLIREVRISYQKWQIVHLQEAFSKISIPTIRNLTKSAITGDSLATNEEVENLVRETLSSGLVNGTLQPASDGKPAYLEFTSPVDSLTEDEFAIRVAEAAQRIKDLNLAYKAANERLVQTKEYLRFLHREKRRVEKGLDGHEPPDEFMSHVEDEDLMGSVYAGGV